MTSNTETTEVTHKNVYIHQDGLVMQRQSTESNMEMFGLKIRVSTVRFRPWPPVLPRPLQVSRLAGVLHCSALDWFGIGLVGLPTAY
jgi:hypothetical protein